MTYKHIYLFFISILIILFFRVIEVPLLGAHSWRQADTNFISYSFCFEDKNILYPRIPIRGETSGIAIGEFPLFSWINALPCMITGNWSELTPRIMTLIYFLLASWVWSLFFRKRSNGGTEDQWIFLILFTFSTLNFVFLTRTLPDGLGLLLIGLSGLLIEIPKTKKVAPFAFVLGFLIRPYFAGLLFLVMKKWRDRIVTGIVMILGYLFWFKYWKLKSEVNNFNVRLKPIEELMSDAPQAFGDLVPHILQWQLNIIGIVLLILGWRYYKKNIGVWLITVSILLFTSGKHYTNHQYYMLGSALVLVWFMACSAKQILKTKLPIFLSLYAAISILSRGNEFHFPKHRDWIDVPKIIQEKSIPFDSRVTTADGIDPNWLYYAKRFGYTMNRPEKFDLQKLCIGSSKFVLYRAENGPVALSCDESR